MIDGVPYLRDGLIVSLIGIVQMVGLVYVWKSPASELYGRLNSPLFRKLFLLFGSVMFPLTLLVGLYHLALGLLQLAAA